MTFSLHKAASFDIQQLPHLRTWLKNLWGNCYELFIPLILVAVYFGYSSTQHQQRMGLIEQPQIHDFYFVDYHRLAPTSDAKYRYLPIKVKSIDSGNVVFKIGNIAHTEKVSANSHVKSDAAMHRNYFRKEELALPVSQLRSLAKQGVIYDIARPTNIFIEGWMVMQLSELNTENSGS